VSDFRKLLVWEKAHDLAVKAHQVGGRMRRSRDASLRNQLVRSAMSIPSNIVEGRRQRSEREFRRFLNIALHSAFELEYHLMMARDIGAIAEQTASPLLAQTVEVRKMIFGLLRKIAERLGEEMPSGLQKNLHSLPAQRPDAEDASSKR
jgi:four helix bundle protein